MMILTAGARRRGATSSGIWSTVEATTVPQQLITIPTPEGSGQTVHPSVVDMGAAGWNGYRWWQANTPYPNDDDTTENPIIVASNDQVTWVVPPGHTNPLEAWSGVTGEYHSDTELAWDPDGARMVAYWRTTTAAGTVIKGATSTNGSDWTLHGTISGVVETPNMSPVVNRLGPNSWRMLRFGNTTLPRVYDAASPLGPWPWAHAAVCSMSGVAMSKWWHGDVIRYADQWLMLVTDRINCHPAISADGVNWTVGAACMTGSTSMAELYRPSMAPSPIAGHIDVWVGGFTPAPRQSRTAFARLPLSTWLAI